MPAGRAAALALDGAADWWIGNRRCRRCAEPLEGTGRFDPPTVPLDADGQGVPYATYGFAAQLAALAVDLELGTVKVAAHRRRA